MIGTDEARRDVVLSSVLLGAVAAMVGLSYFLWVARWKQALGPADGALQQRVAELLWAHPHVTGAGLLGLGALLLFCGWAVSSGRMVGVRLLRWLAPIGVGISAAAYVGTLVVLIHDAVSNVTPWTMAVLLLVFVLVLGVVVVRRAHHLMLALKTLASEAVQTHHERERPGVKETDVSATAYESSGGPQPQQLRQVDVGLRHLRLTAGIGLAVSLVLLMVALPLLVTGHGNTGIRFFFVSSLLYALTWLVALFGIGRCASLDKDAVRSWQERLLFRGPIALALFAFGRD